MSSFQTLDKMIKRIKLYLDRINTLEKEGFYLIEKYFFLVYSFHSATKTRILDYCCK